MSNGRTVTDGRKSQRKINGKGNFESNGTQVNPSTHPITVELGLSAAYTAVLDSELFELKSACHFHAAIRSNFRTHSCWGNRSKIVTWYGSETTTCSADPLVSYGNIYRVWIYMIVLNFGFLWHSCDHVCMSQRFQIYQRNTISQCEGAANWKRLR